MKYWTASFMTLILLVLSLAGCVDNFSTPIDLAGEWKWTRINGSWGTDYGKSVLDTEGNIYIAGTINNGSSGNDIFIAKFDSNGNRLWYNTAGGADFDMARSITIAPDGFIYITGYTTSADASFNPAFSDNRSKDIFVLKYDKTGNYVTRWIFNSHYDIITSVPDTTTDPVTYVDVTTVTNGDESAAGIAVDKTGNIYITGEISALPDVTSFTFEGYSITDSATYTTFTSQAMTVTANSDSAFTRLFVLKIAADNSGMTVDLHESTTSTGGSGIITDGSDNVYIAGFTSSALDGEIPYGGTDICVIKYSSAFVRDWTKIFGGSGDDAANSIKADSAGALYVTGNVDGYTAGTISVNSTGLAYSGSKDILLFKIDGSGAVSRTILIGGTGEDDAGDTAFDALGNIYVAGNINYAADGEPYYGGTDALVIKLDSSWNRVWTRTGGGSLDEIVTSVSVDSAFNLYLCGITNSSFDGQQNSNSSGTTPDIFIQKYW